MLKFLLGIIVGVVLLVAGGWFYLTSGRGPVAVADPPFPHEEQIATAALRARMTSDAPTRDVTQMTTVDLLAGADIYKKDCAFCHGLPDQPDAEAGVRMYPPAPQLMKPPQGRGGGGQRGPGDSGANGQQQAPQGTVRGRGASGDFWRVKNGVRLTGMPSFENSLSDDQMWQVIALIARRRNLPPEIREALKPELTMATAPTTVSHATAKPPAH